MKRDDDCVDRLAKAKRVVIKAGSRVLVQKNGRPDGRRLRSLVKQISKLHAEGVEVVLVTSGAIGAGIAALGLSERPKDLPGIQMAAAIGQLNLMSRYAELFKRERCKVGQVLLTHDDFHERVRTRNARRTIERMLAHGVIPIVNENDVVAVEEIAVDVRKLGDNDVLAALVSGLIGADLLIMLTTADGLREPAGGNRTRRVPYVAKVTRSIHALVRNDVRTLSTGGMGSKLKAVEEATNAGATAVIADGRKPGVIGDIVGGKDVGTYFAGQ